MSALTPEQRGDMVEAVLPEATSLAVEVREGTPDDIRTRLAGLSRHELEAVAVVLAAMVDPDRTLGELLGWVDFDEHGRPVEGTVRQGASWSVRECVPQRAPDRSRGVDMVAVNRALRPGGGEIAAVLTAEERRVAVQVGLGELRMTKAVVAERLGMQVDAVARSWERWKRRPEVREVLSLVQAA
ncbi:hypothetical protein [Streptomyces chilikensis]|uniref:Uncharacterized protein n=1 Tax=Streptomyces chilikensis TaxID=1194079 RepID=A0ABV3ERM5_9ACTN